MPTTESLAARSAAVIHRGFDSYRRSFRAVTKRARRRFEQRDRRGMQHDTAERIDLYRRTVQAVVYDLQLTLGGRVGERPLWNEMRTAYADRIDERSDWELAETFFNSITRRVFDTVGVDPEVEFVAQYRRTPPPEAVIRVFDAHGTVADLFEIALSDVGFGVEFSDVRTDAERLAERMKSFLREHGMVRHVDRLELAESVFYRDERAYLVGRVFAGGGSIPLGISVQNRESGLVVEAMLLGEDVLSQLFSFARSYFHVAARRPYDLVRFLKEILPRKRTAELYISCGFDKHGKTELYRDLLRHLAQTDQDEQFERAAGQEGLVMSVFTMPSYDVVFKLIKDHFGAPKKVTKQDVLERYALVFRMDRAGRLVDAQPFEHLSFERSRFSDALLDNLLDVAGRTVRLSDDGQTVNVAHVYAERQVTPLDVFVRSRIPLFEKPGGDAALAEATAAVLDYGCALKDLARSNIFPGDLLPKNFGVTRHGRVVFYDYDELELMTDMVYRAVPEAKHAWQEMSAQPWYSVGPQDVFPETLASGLGLPEPLRSTFLEAHGDLFTAAWWQEVKEELQKGEPIPILPFDADALLR
jgi:isocitrate dehydrogenase kinase/phosphatase